MKIARALLIPSMALALGTLSASTVLADMEKTTTTTEKTTTYKGTVSEVNPSASTIILRSSETSAPTTYTYNKETIFTDDGGKVVTYDAIKDSPVTVTYTRDGDRMIVTKVTKDPTVKRETTTTTTTH
ncbi:MAG: hypothetical protein ABI080_06150 [Candidatus Binatia bacterium]